MPDPGSPDQGSKPRGQGPTKGAFGWYKQPTGEPQKLNLGDDQPYQDQTPATNQETPFRDAAIKCFQMEQQIINIVENNYPARKDRYQISPELWLGHFSNGQITIQSDLETMQGIMGENVTVEFQLEESSVSREIIRRLNSTSLLPNVGIYAIVDHELLEAQKTYVKKHNHDGGGATEYFFTEKGDYYKICHMPMDAGRVEGRKLIIDDPVFKNIYESEMTADDFEIAGQALQMLINRLKPQEAQEEAV